MTRKNLVSTLSIIYVISGFWDLGIFLYLLFTWSGLDLDITQLVKGALELYMGCQLFKLQEAGRKFTIVYLYLCLTMNLFFIFQSLSRIKDFSVSSLYFLDKKIYTIDTPYATLIFLLTSAMITLIIIVFLSQSETRKLFASQSNKG